MSTNDQQPPANPPFDPSSTVPFGRPEPTPAQGSAPQAPGSAPQTPGSAPQAPGSAPQAPGSAPQAPGYPWQAGAQPYPTPSQGQPQPGGGQPYPGPGQASGPADGPGAQPFASQPYPGQPYASQPGPGQPFGDQPGSGQAGPGQPFVGQPNPGQPYSPPPGAPVPPTSSSSNKNLLWILGGSIAAVLVIALIVVFVVIRPGANRPGGGGTPGGGGEVKANSAQAAVQGFLEALAAGDAATAMGYAGSTPSDTSLLTNEVLAASNATAPITEIKVTAPSSKYMPTSATYMLGDVPVTAEFSTTEASGTWKLRNVTRDVSLSGMTGVALTLNGAAVTGTKLVVFPGAYTLATANPNYKVGGGSFTATSPDDYSSPNFELSLSSTGLTALRNAAQTHLAYCVRQTSLAPKTCGFAIRSAGSGATRAKWTISSGKNAMRNASFRLDYQDPTQAKAYTSISLKVKGYNRAGKYVGYGSAYISTALADMSSKTVTVTFD